jgi:alanine-synthesizing transaminase
LKDPQAWQWIFSEVGFEGASFMIFSDIVQRFGGGLNALYRERDARRAKGKPVIDLVSGNVNRAGFVFPPAALKQALAAGVDRAKIYAPDPLGQLSAREAIQQFYRREGVPIPAEQIVLTAGTSLSYAYLFKILANPEDEILCPTPSYPLLDSIAEFSGIRLTKYRLAEKSRWEIDLDDLRSQITPRTRAIVLISPHNPTGAVATYEEIAALVEIADEHDLPIISDEVFSAFIFNGQRLPRPAGHAAPLVFTLNGISKLFALPGMKIGWIGVTGESAAVQKAVRALDMISDTFLPVNEVAQAALPLIFKKGSTFLKGFQKEVEKRAAFALEKVRSLPHIEAIPPEGGFYITLRLKTTEEEPYALNLLRKEGILVHPGYFYDMEGNHIILSFVSPLPHMKRSFKKLQSF